MATAAPTMTGFEWTPAMSCRPGLRSLTLLNLVNTLMIQEVLADP